MRTVQIPGFAVRKIGISSMNSCTEFGFVLFMLVLTGCASAPEGRSPTPYSGLPGEKDVKYSEDAAGQNQKLVDSGLGYYFRGDFSRAINQLETAMLLEDQSQHSWARYVLYYCYMATGDYQSALDTAKLLVKARPHESLSYQQVGMAELWMGKYASAIENFKRALEFETHSPDIYFYLGLAQEKSGTQIERDTAFQKAEEEFKEVLKANPWDFDANYSLASLYLYWNRNLDKAASLIEVAKQSVLREAEENLAPEKSVYLSYYLPRLEGILLHLKGNIQGSLSTFFGVVSHAPSGVKPELAEVYLYIGKNYRKIGDVNNALSFLEKAEKLDPRGPYVSEIRKELRTLSSRKNPAP